LEAKNQPHHEKETTLVLRSGMIRYSFPSAEFVNYQRSAMWYLGAGIVSLGIILLGILTHTITLTIAFVLFLAVYWLLHHEEAKLIETSISENGIRYGNEFYPFDEIENYWFIYKPPFVADLKLKMHRKFNSVITIHIFGQTPENLRAIIGERIKEVKKDEEFTDLLVRSLKL